MHPLFLTIANIHLSVRMKATSHAWACVRYIPTPEFLTHSNFHSVLEGRLWHRCLNIICSGLKVAASIGTFMTDPNNCTRYTFTPLAAYTADLLEQQTIACITKSASPVTWLNSINLAMVFVIPHVKAKSHCRSCMTCVQVAWTLGGSRSSWPLQKLPTSTVSSSHSSVTGDSRTLPSSLWGRSYMPFSSYSSTTHSSGVRSCWAPMR